MEPSQNDANAPDREMFKGNWKCAECGADITELPFEPKGDGPLYCRDCHSKRKPQRRGSFQPREMVKGDWKCSDCGKEITELPFEPAPDRPIYCRECWAKNKK